MDVDVSAPTGVVVLLGFIAVLILIVQFVHFSPTIRKKGSVLLITSNWKHILFGLGFGSKQVRVEPKNQAIRIHNRFFWVFNKYRYIPFAHVAGIVYRYVDMSIESWGKAYQSTDMFIIGLQLHNGEVIYLFRFVGAGEFVNNTLLPDWCFWGTEAMAELTHGGQESESRSCADILCHLLKVPLVS